MLKSGDVAYGICCTPLLVANAYQVDPTSMIAGSGKLDFITGPAMLYRLDKGAAVEGAESKESSAAALKRSDENIESVRYCDEEEVT